MYDYLIVGAGLFGAVFAHEAVQAGKKCLVIDKRRHIGGNTYTEEVSGIQVHMYGAHVFHTDKKDIWEYMQRFAEFNQFVNSPVALYKGEIYNLPFNMNTFSKLWGVVTPKEAKEKLDEQIKAAWVDEPHNLEQQALNLVGKDIYEKLIKGYTEKQWGRAASALPPFIIKRLPVRLTYDNNYFNDRYQGVPIGGYTKIAEKLLDGIEVRLDTDYFSDRRSFDHEAKKVVFTGMIDEYYDYKYGALEYRSLRFETQELREQNFQGNAIVNYTEYEIPFTRIIEHKHFEYGAQPTTVITREYPAAWTKGQEPYYPVNDAANNELYAKYKAAADNEKSVIFGGRLGMYRYFDMHQVVGEALAAVKKELHDEIKEK